MVIRLGELRWRSPIGETVDVPSLCERGEGGYRSKRDRYLPVKKKKHEIHSWAKTLAAWLPKIRFSTHRYIHTYIYKSTYLIA